MVKTTSSKSDILKYNSWGNFIFIIILYSIMIIGFPLLMYYLNGKKVNLRNFRMKNCTGSNICSLNVTLHDELEKENKLFLIGQIFVVLIWIGLFFWLWRAIFTLLRYVGEYFNKTTIPSKKVKWNVWFFEGKWNILLFIICSSCGWYIGNDIKQKILCSCAIFIIQILTTLYMKYVNRKKDNKKLVAQVCNTPEGTENKADNKNIEKGKGKTKNQPKQEV